MKKAIKYINIGLLTFLVAGFYSCNEFEEFESIPASSPSSVEISAEEVGDSSIVVSVQNSSAGYVVAGIAPAGTDSEVDPDDFVKQNVGDFTYKKAKVEGGEAASFEFTDLVQNTEYVIVTVGTNSDGVASEPANVTVTTTDDYEPSLVETSPSPAFDPVMGFDGELIVAFDEPVNYDDTKTITFSGYLSDVAISEVDVEVSGNEVVITPADTLRPSDIVFVSWEEGTFSDLTGNGFPAMESGLDGEGYPYGLYFGVAPYVYEPVSVSPDTSNTVLPTEFDAIRVGFEDPIMGLGEGEMKVVYHEQNGDMISRIVTDDQVTIEGDVLEVELPMAPSAGQVVEFVAEEGAVFVGLGNASLGLLNPSVAMEISWEIEHPLQTWLGSYFVEAASYGDPGNWDEEWDVTISPSAGDLNTLLITGIAGGENSIEAVFDDEAMTVTIEPGANIGDAYGYGDVGLYEGNEDLTVNEEELIIGEISEDGSIHIDLLGLVLLDDPNTGYVWDVFDTTWTKQ